MLNGAVARMMKSMQNVKPNKSPKIRFEQMVLFVRRKYHWV